MKIQKIVPPPVLFLLCLIAGAIVHRRRPLELAPYPFVAGVMVGCVLLSIAAIIGGWALRDMRSHRTPIEPWEDPRQLVTSGPFRVTRNPLYVTLVTVLLAIAVMVNSLWLIASAALLVILLDRIIIVREEAILGRTFGVDYDDYKRRVRRWI
ncbi:MAG TPA: isoprenylcysteine carboxylmethyltransferase family protein [Thermoanaerobaculia bacterium]|nr:isoprenylcysteine carboxylmethyltransferase family protein [Thermoanaerobaculia bacterium]